MFQVFTIIDRDDKAKPDHDVPLLDYWVGSVKLMSRLRLRDDGEWDKPTAHPLTRSQVISIMRVYGAPSFYDDTDEGRTELTRNLVSLEERGDWSWHAVIEKRKE